MKNLDPKTIARQVAQKTFSNNLKALSKAKGDDIYGEVTLNFSQRVSKIQTEWRALSQNASIQCGTKVDATVYRLIRKPAIGRGATVRLGDSSGTALMELLVSVL